MSYHTFPGSGGSFELFYDEGGEQLKRGWYWWACFPGCLPDGEPNGPFDTREAALADAEGL